MPLISLNQAAAQGITRVRLPRWALPMDHVQITITSKGVLGIWVKLYRPHNLALNKKDPVPFLMLDTDVEAEIYEAYTGPLPDSEEYLSFQKDSMDLFAKSSQPPID